MTSREIQITASAETTNDKPLRPIESYVDLSKTPESLFSELNRIFESWILQGRSGQPVTSEIVESLNNNYGVDVLSLATDVIKSGYNVFDIINILNPVLPKLILEPKTLVSYWEQTYQATTNDMAAGLQYESLPALVQAKPNMKSGLFTLLGESAQPFTIGYMSEIRLALAENNLRNEFDEAMSMTASTNQFEVIAGINALGRMKYPRNERSLISDALAKFEELENNAPNEVLCAIAQCLGNLLVYRKSIATKFVRFLEYDAPEIDYTISRILFVNKDNWHDEKWFKNAYLELSRTKIENVRILKNLDYISHSYLKNNDYEVVRNFLFKWAIHNNYIKHQLNLSKLFDCVFSDFFKKTSEVESFLTHSFLHESSSVHNLATEFIGYAMLHKIGPVGFCKSTLSSASHTDLIYIVRKVLVHIYQCAETSTLILSMLKKSPRNTKLKNLIFEVFDQHIGPNYPASTIKFLKAEQKASRSSNKIKLCERIIDSVESKLNESESLPFLNEFQPTLHKLRRAEFAHQIVMKRSAEEANKDSLVSIFTRVPLKYGRGTFWHNNGRVMDPTPMSTFSTSLELPKSEVNFPVKAAMQRYQFKLCEKES